MDEQEPGQQFASVPGRSVSKPVVLGLIMLGAVIGGMSVEYWLTRHTPTPSAQQAAAPSLTADVTQLKAVTPTQSHTMKDVEDHWSNLWFAAEHKNWPLARFFFDQARQSVRWTVALRPVRQLADGGTVDIKGMFTAVDMTAFADVQLAIEDQDTPAFQAAYRQALEACYTCHKAVEMPFLRPKVPTAAATTMINLDPSTK